ncbi:MAG: tetratricopeptide repeat protein, partial [Bacteroidales bacterium]|nr:tetratricopeptide repeat protein [Bacteroidales bacterium]
MKNKHRNIKIILSSLILLFAINILPQQAKAQSYDQELATQYMNAGDYDKAAVLWEQLYEKYRFRSYLNNYMKCLNALNDFKTAEKFLKKEIRKNSNDASLLVELGVVYQTNGNQSEANKQFDKAIKQSTGTKQVTTNTANYFLTHRLFDNAET